MLAHQLFRRLPSRLPSFATAVTRDSVDYYQLLQLSSTATEEAIRQAYSELTSTLDPEHNPSQYKAINEAFVILTDSKARDAYDSLLGVKKSYYLSPNEDKAVQRKSYLAARKANSEQALFKKANIDQFGRYKGGLPRPKGQLRGNSLGTTGVMHRQNELEEVLDQFPEFNNISKEKAESFKDFHQDERQARTMKWPWFTFEVDYDYFTFSTFRTKYWPRIQLVVFLLYILPVFYYAVDRQQKNSHTQSLKAKAQATQTPTQ